VILVTNEEFIADEAFSRKCRIVQAQTPYWLEQARKPIRLRPGSIIHYHLGLVQQTSSGLSNGGLGFIPPRRRETTKEPDPLPTSF
jgi:hypothetical protein